MEKGAEELGPFKTFLSGSSARCGQIRDSHIYIPARFRKNRQYPLLIVHDGVDYLRFADLQIVLELEAKLMREADQQRPGEGVIDLAQARAEIVRRLDRLAG